MFSNCTSFNQPLDKWKFNSTKFSNIGIFNGCKSFNQDLDKMYKEWNKIKKEYHFLKMFRDSNYYDLMKNNSLIEKKIEIKKQKEIKKIEDEEKKFIIKKIKKDAKKARKEERKKKKLLKKIEAFPRRYSKKIKNMTTEI